MQPSLSPLGGKHYRHYSQLFGVHNALGEYFKYEGRCHYNKNKSQNLERDLEGEREIKECVAGAIGLLQHPTKTFSSFSFSSSLTVILSFSLERKISVILLENSHEVCVLVLFCGFYQSVTSHSFLAFSID